MPCNDRPPLAIFIEDQSSKGLKPLEGSEDDDFRKRIYFDLDAFQTDAAGDGIKISAGGYVYGMKGDEAEVEVMIATVEEIL